MVLVNKYEMEQSQGFSKQIQNGTTCSKQIRKCDWFILLRNSIPSRLIIGASMCVHCHIRFRKHSLCLCCHVTFRYHFGLCLGQPARCVPSVYGVRVADRHIYYNIRVDILQRLFRSTLQFSQC